MRSYARWNGWRFGHRLCLEGLFPNPISSLDNAGDLV